MELIFSKWFCVFIGYIQYYDNKKNENVTEKSLESLDIVILFFFIIFMYDNYKQEDNIKFNFFIFLIETISIELYVNISNNLLS